MAFTKAIRLLIEPIRSVVFGNLSANYLTLGTPMIHAVRIFYLTNYTDTGVMISFDGVHDHLALVPNGYMILDITANKTLPEGFFLAEGQQVYVKTIGALPTTGSVYFTVFYGTEY